MRKFTILLLLMLTFLLYAKKIYLDRGNNANGESKLILELESSEINTNKTSNLNFWIGKGDSLITKNPIVLINKYNYRSYFNIDDSIKDKFSNIDELILSLDYDEEEYPNFGELTIKPFVEYISDDNLHKAKLDYKWDETKNKFIITNLEPIITINVKMQDDNLKSFLNSPAPRLEIKLSKDNTEVVSMNKNMEFDVYDYEKAKLVTDFYEKPIDDNSKTVNINNIPIKIKKDPDQIIESLQIFMNDDNMNKIAIYDGDFKDEVIIPEVDYKNLTYSVKFESNGNYKEGEIEFNEKENWFEFAVGDAGLKSFIALVPQKYQDNSFVLEIYSRDDHGYKKLNVERNSERIKIPFNKTNIEQIYYLNKSGIRKLVTFADNNKLEIHEKMDIVVVDLNYTNSVTNKKANTDYVSFVNDILAKTNKNKYTAFQFYNLFPNHALTFDNYNINSIIIDPQSKFAQKLQITNINRNNYKEFVTKLKENNLNPSSYEVKDNFFVFEPFFSDKITRIKKTNEREQINYDVYQNRFKKILDYMKNERGISLNRIIYISYYPMELESDLDQIDYYSYTSDKEKILSIIGE